MCALESVAFTIDVAFLKFKFRAHFFQRGKMQIHRARPNGAAAGHGHAGNAEPSQQRAKAEHRGAHGFRQFIRRFAL